MRAPNVPGTTARPRPWRPSCDSSPRTVPQAACEASIKCAESLPTSPASSAATPRSVRSFSPTTWRQRRWTRSGSAAACALELLPRSRPASAVMPGKRSPSSRHALLALRAALVVLRAGQPAAHAGVADDDAHARVGQAGRAGSRASGSRPAARVRPGRAPR